MQAEPNVAIKKLVKTRIRKLVFADPSTRTETILITSDLNPHVDVQVQLLDRSHLGSRRSYRQAA